MPFTLSVGLLSRVFGGLGDKIGARAMLIAGPAGAALAYVWMALGQEASLMLGVLGPDRGPVDVIDRGALKPHLRAPAARDTVYAF